ncbi:hypothetical protein SBOR_1566 [Sclerotinia borealis F-4128]|uniref:Uncharacterized protein n=1 Tax=Sclerotinia borealis (strain F-4128) TaxID=1432307 RepID=W9CU46_SCLBF|nr:hypothetical protein SBOR_1566 [Sclerotinia borealis F-4128]
MNRATEIRLVTWLVQTDPVIRWIDILDLATADPTIDAPGLRHGKRQKITGTRLKKFYHNLWNSGRRAAEGTERRQLSEMLERCETRGRGRRVQTRGDHTMDDYQGDEEPENKDAKDEEGHKVKREYRVVKRHRKHRRKDVFQLAVKSEQGESNHDGIRVKNEFADTQKLEEDVDQPHPGNAADATEDHDDEDEDEEEGYRQEDQDILDTVVYKIIVLANEEKAGDPQTVEEYLREIGLLHCEIDPDAR